MERSDTITLGNLAHFSHFRHLLDYTRLAVEKLRDNMTQNVGITTHKILWCDLCCKWANAARLEALDGSCHTFQSLWCRKLKKHVTKNAPCEVLFGQRRPTTKF